MTIGMKEQRELDSGIGGCRYAVRAATAHNAPRQPRQLEPVSSKQVLEHRGLHSCRERGEEGHGLFGLVSRQRHALGLPHGHGFLDQRAQKRGGPVVLADRPDRRAKQGGRPAEPDDENELRPEIDRDLHARLGLDPGLRHRLDEPGQALAARRAARAYSEATVIAVGMELEKSAAVTPKSLHEALGGRGSRSTPFTTWESFVEARGRPAPQAVPVATSAYSSPVNGLIADMLRIVVAITAEVRRETAEPLELRADHLLGDIDRLLADRAALEAEIADLRAAQVEAAATPKAEAFGEDGAPRRSLLVILPLEPRPAPRERIGTWRHQP
jgi:hypothetical protein